jgi:hypothetical protein
VNAIAALWLRQRSGRPSQIPRLLDASWETSAGSVNGVVCVTSLSRTATRACELPHISRSGVYPNRPRALRSKTISPIRANYRRPGRIFSGKMRKKPADCDPCGLDPNLQ